MLCHIASYIKLYSALKYVSGSIPPRYLHPSFLEVSSIDQSILYSPTSLRSMIPTTARNNTVKPHHSYEQKRRLEDKLTDTEPTETIISETQSPKVDMNYASSQDTLKFMARAYHQTQKSNIRFLYNKHSRASND